MAKKIFVSWSSDRGRKLAEALKETILDDSELDPWVSSHNLDAGAPWFEEIERAANECEIAIGCITPGAGQRPWVNFEAGMLFGKLRNFKALLFNEELKGPLANLQSLDGTSREQLERLLKTLLSNPERAARHLNRVYPDWSRRVQEVFTDPKSEHEIRQSAEGLRDSVLVLSRNPVLSTNVCLRTIVMNSLQELRTNLADVRDTYRAPQMNYPHHLLYLQQEHRARVRAIALLQEPEEFWQRTMGARIRDSALRESERVFVVRNEEQLEEHWTMLERHAKTYQVYVLSYDELTRRFEDRFVRDFSIIDVNGSRVLAAYDNSHAGYIEYTTDEDMIAEFDRTYDEITQRAVHLDAREQLQLDTIKAEVFASRALTTLLKRPVEMSVYVPVDDYDSHEEEHAYFIEMMDRMIAEFDKRFPTNGGPYRALEFGAGTGIFTRRIAAVPAINEIVAFEIDWACFKKLAYNVRNAPAVRPLNEDSRRFSPTGRFHAVFSSFADHHIKPQDKRDYLRNVRRNLHENGVFIVGDEFLPPHATGDKAARLQALAAYHGHIIEIARSKGHDVLVQLETAAWESGNREIGDFKVTCEEYESSLRESGFTFDRFRIGPPSDDMAKQVGGVYVYVAVPVSVDVTNQRY